MLYPGFNGYPLSSMRFKNEIAELSCMANVRPLPLKEEGSGEYLWNGKPVSLNWHWTKQQKLR